MPFRENHGRKPVDEGISTIFLWSIIKTNTSVALRKKFPFLSKLYPRKEGVWSTGYFVSTVGINEAIIARYIKMQEREDCGQAKLVFKKKPRA